ncbi:MAG: hypothetical protein VX777_01360 [Chlamydiota bacterium]|nr:hypothetical protein [Chlamydiota bacterium]
MEYINQGKVGLILLAILITILQCDRHIIGWDTATFSKGESYSFELANLSEIKKGNSLVYLEDPYHLYE